MKKDNRTYDLNNVLLERYLINSGWKKDEEFKNTDLYVYSKFFQEYENDYYIAIPAKENFEDYFERVNIVLDTLSTLSGNTINQIIDEMLNQNRDVLKVRIISEFSKDGSIPLGFAANLVSGLKELMVSSVTNEILPTPFHKRNNNEALNYANQYRFAQTQVGSFIVNIEGVSYEHEMQINMENELEMPLTRKAMERIQNGLSFIKTEQNENKLQEMSYKIGLNANMCDSLLKVASYNLPFTFESKIQWAANFPPSKDVPEAVLINEEELNKIEKLSSFYKNEENYAEITITGKIITLHAQWRDMKEDRILDNIITIQWKDDGSYHQTKVQLNDSDYKIACDAHRDKKKITISGTLDKCRKRWYLENAKDFKVF